VLCGRCASQTGEGRGGGVEVEFEFEFEVSAHAFLASTLRVLCIKWYY
jgi:hypothetical protein